MDGPGTRCTEGSVSMITVSPAADLLMVKGSRWALLGEVEVPGDKSITHRSLMLGALANGTTRITNALPATDCIATLEMVRALGIEVDQLPSGEILVHGKGIDGLREPIRPLECGGSGTTIRLMAGILAGQPFYSVLASNAQLGRRPMDRIATPLRQMGATVLGRQGGKFTPLTIQGGNLNAITYSPPVASAQIKSAVLLAGLFANGITTVDEILPTRDHTERMLSAMRAQILRSGTRISITPCPILTPLDIRVPGDLSSAAFLLVAASIVPGSRLLMRGIGVNPGRIGILAALQRMGANLSLENEETENGEPVADLRIAYNSLQGITITPEDVPGLIDELPVIAVAATQANGITEVRGAAELRVKETDRIGTTVSELQRMGANIEALPDGFRIQGPTPLHGANVSSHGDHRLAMALTVAALVADGETMIEGIECTRDSFPGFEDTLAQLVGAGATA
jgi:3-phosphoshikimate 1-carboxyvinyltransferase